MKTLMRKSGLATAEAQRRAHLYEWKHVALEALKKSLHQAFTGAL